MPLQSSSTAVPGPSSGPLQSERATPTTALQEEEQLSQAIEAPSTPPSRYLVPLTFSAAGSANAISATITNPTDIVKVRQQLLLDRARKSFWRVGVDMSRNEGFKSLFNGVTASCLRELTYGTIRMGSYESFKTTYSSALSLSPSSFSLKVLAGVTSGSVGALISTPTDLLKVRMQAPRPTGKPPYRNTFVGFYEIYKLQGLKGLWKGVWPNTIRAAILTSSQIGSYDEVKSRIKRTGYLKEGVGLHLSASMVAGFVASVCSQPVDVLKVRLMSDKKGEFRNALHCLTSLITKEGPMGLYKGFAMCWARLGSHTVISLVLFEQFRSLLGIKPL